MDNRPSVPVSKNVGRRLLIWIPLGGMSVVLLLGVAACGDRAAPSSVALGREATVDLTRVICIRSGSQGQCQAFYDRYAGQPTPIPNLALCLVGGTADFAEGLVAARRPSDTIHNSPAGYVDATGRVVIPFQYDWAAPFHERRASVGFRGKHGLIDSKGSWVVAPGKYDAVGPVEDGRCPFKMGEKWGFLDRDGAVVVPAHYRSITSYRDGRCLVEDDGLHYSCLDPDGRVCFELPEGARSVGWGSGGGAFSNGLARILYAPPLANYRYGYVDTTGRVAIASIYRQAGDFSEGLAPVSKNAETSFNDDASSEGERPPGKDDAWGFIDASGRVVIPFTFTRVGRFFCGLARAREGEKWGYIDRTGKFVVQPTYEDAYDFRDGVARVTLDNKYVFIDLTGRVIVKTSEEVARF